MASSIKNQNDYERAKTAYITGNYEEAASIIEKLAESSPSDPEILLLRGHIYCYFQEFDQAREQYNLVIENTDSAEYIDCANSGLETVRQWLDAPFRDDSIDEPTEASEFPFGDLSEDEITAISALDDDDDDEPLTNLKDTGFSPSQNLDSTHRQVATEISNSQRTNLDDDDPDTAKASPPTPTAEETNANQALFTTSNQEGAGLFSSTASQQGTNDLSFDGEGESNEPIVEQEQGLLAFLDQVSLAKKQQILADAVGVASAVVVALGSFGISSFGENQPGFFGNLVKSSALGLVGGVGSGAVTWVMGGLVVKQVKRSTGDLQAQLYAVQQGNLQAKATVYSQDEFGQLATGFNQMTRVVSTTTKEAQRKAQEQEQAKEDLQRQVIRLLDDVEGVARGDLTVQAEVSADVLGAVADAFNLTIRNLRTIVQQVKEAARQVNEGAAESSSFARGLSEDALRQAEELAVSLNSSQMMTESIQRVADNAKEAESVARTASETALKGGEAVDSTVAGILQIRETVAQSTRKVKRLAESSQEISKIVSVISQIATRTNNLALNASIEAARAGEAGRGFAVIADEVRQLADRSSKSLREIEKIVLQIQSETSFVMIAMEEGTQQVIEGTERAEQAKNALEDIIQASNRIDSLVESITADTVEQSKTAQSVAQVMQSVEMTAQGTSQESQQVSTALQNLVSLAGDLLASVERFRVNPEDELKS
ncbi:methyl-accepting chemotaxis protein [Dactylococcopsis salina]|uniref:Methyl-accepting chemotaxis protein n=1 Tax=Dactylococcopsis salina (strain PCC 8305) TaxID=13035 RepID=K9YZQ8_DACS8|nr:HAMP domain-containing methyl-accepting chemotaxis protein [Dactylococcopsis salina]AFZ51972.1 methyl-accepting chemotaxis protein [Dactylococcopsis salina PCC 8305]